LLSSESFIAISTKELEPKTNFENRLKFDQIMSTFQLLLSKLEREHESKLQSKELIIRDLARKLDQTQKANLSLGLTNDALQLEINVLTSRKARKTTMDSSPHESSKSLSEASEILAGETPPIAIPKEAIPKDGYYVI
jgi:hypothetical protein